MLVLVVAMMRYDNNRLALDVGIVKIAGFRKEIIFELFHVINIEKECPSRQQLQVGELKVRIGLFH